MTFVQNKKHKATYMSKKNLLLSIIMLLFSCIIVSAQSDTTKAIVAGDSISIYSRMAAKHLDSIYQIQKEEHELRKKAIEDRTHKDNKDSREDSEYALMSKIEKNTYVDFYKDGWTLFAIIGLAFSVVTYWAQRKTEKHTKNVSVTSQIGKLNDLPRHFYRNLVCTMAMILKYQNKSNKKGKHYKRYPSESNMLKLQTLPEDFYLDIDAMNDDIFKLMHEQKLLLRNYNLEVDVASMHFARKDITEDSLINDIDNVLFKPMFLISKIFKLRKALDFYDAYSLIEDNMPRLYKYCRSKQYIKDDIDANKYLIDVIYTFVYEHFGKLKLENLAPNDLYVNDNEFDGCFKFRNALSRSYYELIKREDKKEAKKSIEFIEWKGEKCYIDRGAFYTYFINRLMTESDPDKTKTVEKLKNIREAKGVEDLFGKFKITDSDYRKQAKAYFEFWRSDKSCEIITLIYNILKIDAILELPKIGMIEHEA